MKIYLELYFLINYILDISLLIGTGKLLKIKVKIYKYFIGSFIGSLSITFIYINNNITLFLLKIIISILMIISTFGFNNIFRNIIYFYLLSIILGGIFYLLDINFYYNYLLLIILSPLIIYLFVSEILKRKRININKYLITIKYKNNIINTYGYIDTGNCLKDPYLNRNIILIDKYLNIDKPIIVPYKTISDSGIINCFKPDELFINNSKYSNYLIGISKRKINLEGCSCILPNCLLEEL